MIKKRCLQCFNFFTEDFTFHNYVCDKCYPELKQELDEFSRLKPIEHITLSKEDYEMFVEYLNRPAKPNEALKKAIKKYKDFRSEINNG